MGQARYKRAPACERTYNGKVYMSKKEAVRAAELHMLQKLGKISNLAEQVPLEICPKQGKRRAAVYRADFRYEENGETVYEDAKGHRTQLYDLKQRLVLHFHGIKVRET